MMKISKKTNPEKEMAKKIDRGVPLITRAKKSITEKMKHIKKTPSTKKAMQEIRDWAKRQIQNQKK